MNANIRLAIALAVIVFFWMLTGIFGKKAEEPASDEAANTFRVQVETRRAQAFTSPVFLRARTQAEFDVMLASEIDGAIVETPAKEGQRVAKGDVICRVNEETRQLRLVQSQADYDKALIDYQGAQRLKNDGFQSRSQIASALASLKLAEAQLNQAKADVDRLEIKSPFDGVLQERMIDVGDFIQRGKSCARILNLDPIVVVGFLSEDDIAKVDIGDEGQVLLPGYEQAFSGAVRYVSRSAEPTTRSYRVEIALPNEDLSIVDGLTAEVQIKGSETQAHLVSSSLLTLLDNNRVGIRTLNEDSIVEVYPVRILEDAESGIWVSGLPEVARLIVAGQEYVSIGEKVAYVETDSEASLSHSVSESEGRN